MASANKARKNQINRVKGSSHPLVGGGVYKGIVKSFSNGKPTIYVEQLGCTYNQVDYVNNTSTNKLKKNDTVLCTFIDNQTQQIHVIGPVNKRIDVFADVLKFNALIDKLETEINTLRAALSPPLSAIDLESYKQPTT